MNKEQNTRFTAAMLFNSDKALVQEMRNTHDLGEKEMMRAVLTLASNNAHLLAAEVQSFKDAQEAERNIAKQAREDAKAEAKAAKVAEREAAKAAKVEAKAANIAEREANKAAKQAQREQTRAAKAAAKAEVEVGVAIDADAELVAV